MTAPTDPQTTVTKLLAELGDTPDAVADRLRALDVKGYQSSPPCCPVALYLVGRGVDRPLVDDCDVQTGPRSARSVHPNPPAVRAFIHRFDQGVYLDLVESGEAADV